MGVDVAGDGEVVHEHVVEGVVVGVEHHHDQVGPHHQGRREGSAGLGDEHVVVLAEVARQSGCSLAVPCDGLVGVGIDDVDVVNSCPLHALLQLDGGFPSEGERVREHVAVTNCPQNAIPDLLAADWVGNCLAQGYCKQGEDAE